MKRFRRFISGSSAAVLTLSTLMMVGFTGVAHAAANTCTWTGSAGDNKFSTATNWTNCGGTAPQAGDILLFTTNTGSSNLLTNDLGVTLGGIIVQTTGASFTTYTIDTVTLAGGASFDSSASGYMSSVGTSVQFTQLNDSGALTVIGGGAEAQNATIGGLLTLGDGVVWNGANVGSSGVVAQNGSELDFQPTAAGSNATPSYPVSLGGGSGSAEPVLDFYGWRGSGGGSTTWAFANPITLLANAKVVLGQAYTTVNQTGSITGTGFSLSLDQAASASTSSLVLNPSSNTSATVAGTQFGAGSAAVNGAAPSPATPAPKTPDTGFSYVSAHPVTMFVITFAAAGVIVGAARLTRNKNYR